MRILNRFRKKQEDILPDEVDKYYQSQKRARIGTAWMLGFLTLIVTLAIALGLYYGGRYVYREVIDSEDTSEITTDQDQAGSVPEEAGQSENKTDNRQTGPGEDSGPGRRNQSNNGSNSAPATGDRLPSNGDGLPATGDPGL